jgi:hypothetical protein
MVELAEREHLILKVVEAVVAQVKMARTELL